MEFDPVRALVKMGLEKEAFREVESIDGNAVGFLAPNTGSFRQLKQ